MRSAVGQLLDFSTPRARVVLVPARPRADLLRTTSPTHDHADARTVAVPTAGRGLARQQPLLVAADSLAPVRVEAHRPLADRVGHVFSMA